MFVRSKRSADSDPASKARVSAAWDQAQALLSMLEAGGTPPEQAIPPDRLRDLARDVIAQVEARGRATGPVRKQPAPPPSPSPIRSRLFRNPDPFATTRQPDQIGIDPDLPAAILARLPESASVEPTVSARRGSAWLKERAAVDRLVSKAFREEDAADEHPAIVAMTLMAHSPREQAARLRQLPAGRVRATHRYLIDLQRAGSA